MIFAEHGGGAFIGDPRPDRRRSLRGAGFRRLRGCLRCDRSRLLRGEHLLFRYELPGIGPLHVGADLGCARLPCVDRAFIKKVLLLLRAFLGGLILLFLLDSVGLRRQARAHAALRVRDIHIMYILRPLHLFRLMKIRDRFGVLIDRTDEGGVNNRRSLVHRLFRRRRDGSDGHIFRLRRRQLGSVAGAVFRETVDLRQRLLDELLKLGRGQGRLLSGPIGACGIAGSDVEQREADENAEFQFHGRGDVWGRQILRRSRHLCRNGSRLGNSIFSPLCLSR